MRRRTRCVAILVVLSLVAGCSASRGKLAWRAREIALVQAPQVDLIGRNREVAVVDTAAIKKLLLAHFRVTRAAGVHAELWIVEGNEPNAFAGRANHQQVIGINIGMLKLIGDDIEEFAALLGHEAAHIAQRHGEASVTRAKTLQAVGTLVGMGLGSAGVPAGGLIAGLGADLIEASYSRDEEREADSLGVAYARSAGFDPKAAVRLQQKFLKISRGSPLPFLSSHPSSEERIENLKALANE